MAKYRKKPVEVEAFQWTGDVEALKEWLMSLDERASFTADIQRRCPIDHWLIPTDNAAAHIRGVEWIEPDIFEATYEAVEG